LKFLNLVARNYLVVLAAGLPIGFSPTALAIPVLILASIIAITPGNLGISEWGWVGVLMVFGTSKLDAAEFAILRRVVVLVAIILCNVLVALYFLIFRPGRKRISQRKPEAELTNP
jgi:uncharacterized membrane protein YbhN (UPF0104 family)